MTTAPTTALAREYRIHIAYRRSATNHIKSGGQITPDVHADLMAKAEAFVPAVCVVVKRPTISLFDSYMAYSTVTPDKPDLTKINTVVLDSTLTPENGVLSPQKGEISNDPTAELKRDAEPTYILVREKVNLSAPAGDWLLLERTTFDALRIGDVIVYVSEVKDYRTSIPLPPNTKREPVRTIGDYKMIGDSRRKIVNGSVPLADAPVWRLAVMPVLEAEDLRVVLGGMAA